LRAIAVVLAALRGTGSTAVGDVVEAGNCEDFDGVRDDWSINVPTGASLVLRFWCARSLSFSKLRKAAR